MKKLIIFLFTVLSISFLYAQINEYEKERPFAPDRSNEECFQQSEIVFEGHLITTVATYDPSGTGIWKAGIWEECLRTEAYKVQRVYKGIQYEPGDTIYITRRGGYIGLENVVKKYEGPDARRSSVSPYIFSKYKIPCGDNGYSPKIFFLVSSDFEEDTTSPYFSYKKYKFLDKDYVVMYVCGSVVAGLDDLVFWNRRDFYDYMKQFEGFRVPEIAPPPAPAKPKRDESVMDSTLRKRHLQITALLDSIGNAKTEKEVDKYKAALDSLSKKFEKDWRESTQTDGVEIKKKVKQIPKESDYTLSMEIVNKQKIVEDDKHYVTFDININSNKSDIFLERAYMYIQYNTDIFGSWVTNHGQVTITPGTNFNTNTYYKMSGDYHNNKFWVSFFTKPNGVRVLLDTTPVTLLHFKIELLSPTSDWPHAHLIFAYTDDAASKCSYSLSSTGSTTSLFDQVFYDPIDYLPIINSFSPPSIVAGIGDTLTIDGRNFGNIPGTILFKSADDGGKTYLKDLDDQYIVWSDRQIKVIVPSKVYKGYESSSPDGAGSGPIKIFTNSGDSCISTTNLKISYSVTNTKHLDDSVIRRVYFAKLHCNSDIIFKMSPWFETYYNRDNVVKVIDKALRDWSALSGLTLILEKDS